MIRKSHGNRLKSLSEHTPFIGGRRFSEGTSADREIQRTLMELLNQMDGFDSLGQVFLITNCSVLSEKTVKFKSYHSVYGISDIESQNCSYCLSMVQNDERRILIKL